MAQVLKHALSTLKAPLFCQLLTARLLITYILFWYSVPFLVFANNYNLGKTQNSQGSDILNINDTRVTNHPTEKNAYFKPIIYQTNLMNLGSHGYVDNQISKQETDLNPSNDNSTYKVINGPPSETLFNLKPKFSEKFEDSSPSKCYILTVSGGGAKGSFTAGLLNGLAFIYRYHGIKLRWDVTSGVSIGTLNTIWSQFYHIGQTSHFSTEGASIWKNFTHKNVHNCKSTLSRNAPLFIFRAIAEGKKLPNYLCSTYPMLIFMRHLIQNRRRFKGPKWNALAYHFKSALSYYFNEEVPRSIIPSVIRSSSSFPVILEPAEISGIGVFGDGAISKTIDIQNAVHRCLQSGKAKTDKDIVVDLITTSYSDNEFHSILDPLYSRTMLESLSWFFNYYSFTETYQQYEIVQTIRRYPNIQFRHFLSYLDDKDSIVNRMGLLDFVKSYLVESLNDGLKSGFYNSTMFKDFWKPVERNISPHTDWKPYGDNHVIIPNENLNTLNPDSDVFVEFPILKNEPYSLPPIFEFISSSDKALNINNASSSINNLLDRETQVFMLELHQNILSIRFLENVREFIRQRDDELLYIDEERSHKERRNKYLRNNGHVYSRKMRLQGIINIGNGNGPSEKEASNVFSDSINSIPFFKASRNQIISISSSFDYSSAVQVQFINSHSKFKYKKLLKKEKEYRKQLNASFKYFTEKKNELEKLYLEYDTLMEPLNKVYTLMLKLTKNCGKNTRKIPLMFPFLEGEETKNIIWAPSEEYDALTVKFKKSTLKLLSELYPSINWTLNLPERLAERPSRIRNWNKYKKRFLSHFQSNGSQEVSCWAKHPDILKIVSEIKDLTKNISSIKVRHHELITRITNNQILIAFTGVVARNYSANLEMLFRKNFVRNLREVEEIFHKTSHFSCGSELSNNCLSGLKSDEELQTIKDEVLNKITDWD
ncbi:secreted of the alpha beta hydrolase superfamily [Cryptosporidium sp. chipmunk genotype I]|uniref:secreted of the alpha beta hydrolase superfamily n=1 Tax=Cryptosporidium sp. chipmunk genotype I TaxID=1280935 RepID=UPI00351A2021|nr:secreted of the alpha beta hydrolase superfamily [Cryptosporidium sp. chipmunk genotype I]